MKKGDIQQFLKVHRDKGDIHSRKVNLTSEQIAAIKHLSSDQDVSFEDMAMTLIQYQLQLIQMQVDEDIRGRAKLN